jgi:hypothetical protein
MRLLFDEQLSDALPALSCRCRAAPLQGGVRGRNANPGHEWRGSEEWAGYGGEAALTDERVKQDAPR